MTAWRVLHHPARIHWGVERVISLRKARLDKGTAARARDAVDGEQRAGGGGIGSRRGDRTRAAELGTERSGSRWGTPSERARMTSCVTSCMAACMTARPSARTSVAGTGSASTHAFAIRTQKRSSPPSFPFPSSHPFRAWRQQGGVRKVPSPRSPRHADRPPPLAHSTNHLRPRPRGRTARLVQDGCDRVVR